MAAGNVSGPPVAAVPADSAVEVATPTWFFTASIMPVSIISRLHLIRI
jgi:hypothetical protein